MAEPAMTVADAAKYVRGYHDVFCFKLMESLFGAECAMLNPWLRDIELTDQLLLHFGTKAYLIELGYVGVLAMDQNGLGTVTRVSAFLRRVYQQNAGEAENELLSIRNSGQSDRTKHLLSILPLSRTGVSPDEVTRVWPVSAGVAMFGLGNNFLKDMSLPLRRLVELEETVTGDYRMVFRLAVLALFLTFQPQLAKTETQRWEALIAEYWETWFNAWAFVLTEYTELFAGVRFADA